MTAFTNMSRLTHDFVIVSWFQNRWSAHEFVSPDVATIYARITYGD